MKKRKIAVILAMLIAFTTGCQQFKVQDEKADDGSNTASTSSSGPETAWMQPTADAHGNNGIALQTEQGFEEYCRRKGLRVLYRLEQKEYHIFLTILPEDGRACYQVLLLDEAWNLCETMDTQIRTDMVNGADAITPLQLQKGGDCLYAFCGDTLLVVLQENRIHLFQYRESVSYYGKTILEADEFAANKSLSSDYRGAFQRAWEEDGAGLSIQCDEALLRVSASIFALEIDGEEMSEAIDMERWKEIRQSIPVLWQEERSRRFSYVFDPTSAQIADTIKAMGWSYPGNREVLTELSDSELASHFLWRVSYPLESLESHPEYEALQYVDALLDMGGYLLPIEHARQFILDQYGLERDMEGESFDSYPIVYNADFQVFYPSGSPSDYWCEPVVTAYRTEGDQVMATIHYVRGAWGREWLEPGECLRQASDDFGLQMNFRRAADGTLQLQSWRGTSNGESPEYATEYTPYDSGSLLPPSPQSHPLFWEVRDFLEMMTEFTRIPNYPEIKYTDNSTIDIVYQLAVMASRDNHRMLALGVGISPEELAWAEEICFYDGLYHTKWEAIEWLAGHYFQDYKTNPEADRQSMDSLLKMNFNHFITYLPRNMPRHFYQMDHTHSFDLYTVQNDFTQKIQQNYDHILSIEEEFGADGAERIIVTAYPFTMSEYSSALFNPDGYAVGYMDESTFAAFHSIGNWADRSGHLYLLDEMETVEYVLARAEDGHLRFESCRYFP